MTTKKVIKKKATTENVDPLHKKAKQLYNMFRERCMRECTKEIRGLVEHFSVLNELTPSVSSISLPDFWVTFRMGAAQLASKTERVIKTMNNLYSIIINDHIPEKNIRLTEDYIFNVLKGVEKEFPSMWIDFDDRFTITVRTHPIQIFDIHLGCFDIVLDLTEMCYTKSRLDFEYSIEEGCENRINEDGYIHPHVNTSFGLCEGGGSYNITKALGIFDLQSFFLLVQNLLGPNSYRAEDSYCRLSYWGSVEDRENEEEENDYDSECYICGTLGILGDDIYECDEDDCDFLLCDSHSHHCKCSECMSLNPDLGKYLCLDCWKNHNEKSEDSNES